MVTLPVDFTATRFPGYFWNCRERALYSIKIGGVLKKMQRTDPNGFNNWLESGYRISHKGNRRVMRMSYLMKLIPEDSVIPVESKEVDFGNLPF